MEIKDTGEARGMVSSCIRLKDGLWLLGKYQHSGLIVGVKIDENLWDAVVGDPEVTHAIQPGFLLLSGDPEAEMLLEKRWGGDMEVVADGSCSKRYLTRLKAGQRGFYLTDRSGAYAKRW